MVVTTYQLQVDWDNNGDFIGTYDDITSDVLSVSFRRGRDYASQLTGNSSAGKFTAILNNESGKYSPLNASSVLAGNILPARSVRFGTGASASFPYTFPFDFSTEAQDMWAGKLQTIAPKPASTALATCTLEAYGALGYLNEFMPKSITETNIRTDQAIGAILDAADWSVTDRTLAEGKTTMTRWWTTDQATIKALRLVEETEAGFVRESYDGKIVFESRETRLNPPYNASLVTFSDAGGATHSYMTLRQEDPLGTVVNHIEAVYRGYTFTYFADLWTLGDTGADSPMLTPSEQRIWIASYPNTNSPNDAIEVNAWHDLVATTDYTGNLAADGSGNNMTTYLDVDVTKTATQMIITVTNTHTTDNVFITLLKARGDSVQGDDPVIVQAVDSASQAIFGDRMHTAATEFIPTHVQAQSWCNYHMSVFKSPVPILTMTFNANVSQNNMDQAIARDISDRVTVVAQNNANLGINSEFFIENISHKIDQGGTVHNVTWMLSPAIGGYSQLWKLDQGILGQSMVPSF
jgi:hypothetical protein